MLGSDGEEVVRGNTFGADFKDGGTSKSKGNIGRGPKETEKVL